MVLLVLVAWAVGFYCLPCVGRSVARSAGYEGGFVVGVVSLYGSRRRRLYGRFTTFSRRGALLVMAFSAVLLVVDRVGGWAWFLGFCGVLWRAAEAGVGACLVQLSRGP